MAAVVASAGVTPRGSPCSPRRPVSRVAVQRRLVVAAVASRDTRFSYAQHHDAKFTQWLDDLHMAVRSETWDAVPALMRFPRADPRVALHLTAECGQTRLVEAILRRFAKTDESDSDLVTNQIKSSLGDVDAAGAAVAAAARGHHRVLCALLSVGLDANAVDERGVHFLTAAAGGSRDVSSGGDVDSETEQNKISHELCVAVLLEHGADPDACTSRLGWKPLLAAAKAGNVEISNSLLRAGADISVTYHNGKTPLYVAAEWGRLDAVRLLLTFGADSQIKADRLHTNHDISVSEHSKKGILPMEVAAKNGHADVAELLRRANGG